ncbi:hypothetical protein WJX79_006850 [Trebouxia sp. C0005]
MKTMACMSIGSILEELQTAYARTTADNVFDEDFALEAERQDLHSTVEGEENVFEILSGGLEVNQLVELATAQSRRLDCETVLQEVEREHPGELSRMEHKANAPAGTRAAATPAACGRPAALEALPLPVPRLDLNCSLRMSGADQVEGWRW